MSHKFIFVIIIFICFKTMPTHANAIVLDDIRKEYPKAMEDKSICMKWFEQFEKQSSFSDPVLQAYKGGIYMGMAKFAIVAKKVALVNKGKACIEAAILKDKNNVEIRFIRYSVQTKLPAALGYNKNKIEDKNFVTANIASIKNESFRNEIIKYLKENSTP